MVQGRAVLSGRCTCQCRKKIPSGRGVISNYPIMHRWNRFFLFFLAAMLVGTAVIGQNDPYFSFGNVQMEDFHPSSPAIDSDVSVVVLQDVGKAVVEGNSGGWSVKYTRYHRLLIRNKNGFEAAK